MPCAIGGRVARQTDVSPDIGQSNSIAPSNAFFLLKLGHTTTLCPIFSVLPFNF